MSFAQIDFGLPPLAAENSPDFTDEDGARAWLAVLPLTNVALTQTQLLRQLRLLNDYPVRTGERLKILELLREPIDFVQDQCRMRFAGRPLPFNTLEQAAFDSGQALWQELVAGYLHCLHAAPEAADDAALAPHLLASLAATRALATMSAVHLDACQANFLTAPFFWRQLHLIYRAAEKLKVTQLPVEDSVHGKKTAASAFVEPLLVAAAWPIELRSRQVSSVADWAQRWARKVTILRQPPADQRTPALCVDLDSDEPAAFRHHVAMNDALRWLDLTELRKSLKKRLMLLAQGEPPQALQLGTGCEQPACEALLKRTYQCWCKGGLKGNTIRLAARTKSTCQLVSGLEPIHYWLTGQKNLKQDRSIYLGNRQHDEIATFGHIPTHCDEETREAPGFMLEEWRIVDQDATALQLERPLNPPGRPLVREQLVAVRMHEGEGFMLGKLCWIAMSASRDALIARIQLFPGRPEGITIRDSGPGCGHAQDSRCLFLPEVEQVGEMASMLVPTAWFSADRIVAVEAQAKDARLIRLDRLVERGADFERVAFHWQ